ncbi:hypothetical protein [Mycobacteroides salmoniphilum]|uniref:hypothetical protein n=1 Tax=Mycobacteroides salmoniphilum TaxID=404941 RepID=UPI001066C9EC|nr:hypothetical protein [Mycobacteroides salmoniphilum]TDZ81472.1 hypothetical protein DE4586_01426 [Mycobacteroides salmoniphilum]TDZ88972.1 hypothetical protein DE4587_01342 [Mycobacteroides salmoniphilum]
MKRLATVAAVSAAMMFGSYAPTAIADPSTPSPAPSAGTASAGKFCSKDLEDKTGKASDGTVLTCTKGDDGKDRWTASTDSAGADKASAGKFCAKDLEGKTGKATDGTVLTCTKGDDGKDRWAKS